MNVTSPWAKWLILPLLFVLMPVVCLVVGIIHFPLYVYDNYMHMFHVINEEGDIW